MSVRPILASCLAIVAAAAAAACGDGSKLVLNQQAEAHRLAAHLHVQFSRAADASNRAVMADTDEASSAAAREAEQATKAVEHDTDTLGRILDELGDRDEARELDTFKARFAQYRALDADILPLAVENTNIKAQRLSFGPAQEAVDAFRKSVEAAGRLAAPKNSAPVEALVAKAVASVLEVQVIQARHIAESDEAAMTRMESTMKASEAAARKDAGDFDRRAAAGGASPTRRRGFGARPADDDQRRDRGALQAEQQRAIARLVAREEAHRDRGVRREPSGARGRARQTPFRGDAIAEGLASQRRFGLRGSESGHRRRPTRGFPTEEGPSLA